MTITKKVDKKAAHNFLKQQGQQQQRQQQQRQQQQGQQGREVYLFQLDHDEDDHGRVWVTT